MTSENSGIVKEIKIPKKRIKNGVKKSSIRSG